MFETAIPGAGYGSATQQVGPPLGNYGIPSSQFGQQIGLQGAGAFGQPFGAQGGGVPGILAQRFGGYQTPQSVLPLTMGLGATPVQQIQSPFGPPQLGQWQAGQPQFGQPQYGQPQFGQPQFGQPQFGQPQWGQQQFGQPQFGQPQWGQQQFGQPQYGQQQFGQPQFGGQQLGMTQPQVQVIPVVTPYGGFGVLVLATGQPLLIGPTAGGLFGGLGPYQGYGGPSQGIIGGQTGIGGQVGTIGGGYLPLQVQPQIPQQVPQMYGPALPFGGPSFPGQPFGPMPIH